MERHIFPCDFLFRHNVRKRNYKNVDYLNDVIYSVLSKRQEYHRIGRLHIFENQLTHEIIRLEVKKYAIEVESRDKNNIFFDILYHNLKSYVIINENL